jgi:hypothetical protein
MAETPVAQVLLARDSRRPIRPLGVLSLVRSMTRTPTTEAGEDTENTMTQHDRIAYRDYIIWLRSYELATGGWVPKAVVLFPADKGGGEEELLTPGASPLLSREEADAHARALSQQWIDEKIARHEDFKPVKGH